MQVGKVTKKHTINNVYREITKVQVLIREIKRKKTKRHTTDKSLTPMQRSSVEEQQSKDTLNLPTIICCLFHSDQAACDQLH